MDTPLRHSSSRMLPSQPDAAACPAVAPLSARREKVDPEDKGVAGAVDKRASKDHRLFRVSFLRKRKRPYCGLYQSY